ncbi:MAG: M20 family metallo-hydrolase [Candidatus Aminicenantes bacterium]|nr:M20 family metallo-hydrolase [Candidatus Aminicenantes bacterium]
MDAFEKISKRIDSYRDEMIEAQVRLCSHPAVAPSSGGEGEARKAEYLLGLLKTIGFQDISLVKAPDPDAPSGFRPNILAWFKGRSAARTVWVMTHMDVVPPGDLALWRGDPFKAWIEEGRIYGRGTEDNQQDMVASLFAVKALSEEGLIPPNDIAVALVADEETGSEKGIGYVLAHSNPFRKNDLILVPDAGSPDGSMIEVAEKSILWLKFKTQGKQTHGSTPEKGNNSFRAASSLVVDLGKLYRLFPESNRIFDPPTSTFEPTKKEANVPNINTIPGDDVFYMDSRILPATDVEDVLKAVRRLTRRVEKTFEVKIQIEEVQNAPAAPPTSVRAPVVQALKKAVKAVYGVTGRAQGIGGGTVAALFRRAGFEAACWSKLDDTLHQPNEYCVIDNLMGDSKVFAHVFLQE